MTYEYKKVNFQYGCFLIFKTAILRSNRRAAWPAHQFIGSAPIVRRKNIILLLSFYPACEQARPGRST